MSIPTPGEALWNQRHVLAQKQDRLVQLMKTINDPLNLNPYQWLQLSAFVQEYRPDLIVELGREAGNSTCCFLEAIREVGTTTPARLVSLCRSGYWEVGTRPRLRDLCDESWFAPGAVLQKDILTFDYAAALAGAKRVFVFWDAHGFDIAECVLGRLLPLLAGREHVVVMHDLTDLRYNAPPRAYDDQGLWKGEDGMGPAFWLYHVCSKVPQAVSAFEFTCRNRVPFHSAEESLHAVIGEDPARMAELKGLFAGDLFDLQAHWFWFSLNEAAGPVSFPAYVPPAEEILDVIEVVEEPALVPPPAPAPFLLRAFRAVARRVGGAFSRKAG
jgi:hypothetical protein